MPASELVLMELLNISKYCLLKNTNTVPKNKRYKSEYFKVNWTNFHIKLKPRYNLRPGFQAKLGRQFRKGIS